MYISPKEESNVFTLLSSFGQIYIGNSTIAQRGPKRLFLRKVIYNNKMRLRHRAWAEPNKAAQPSRTATNRRTPRASLGILEA